MNVWDAWGESRNDQWGKNGSNAYDYQYSPTHDPAGFEAQAGYQGEWDGYIARAFGSGGSTYEYYRYEPYLLTHRYFDPSTGKFANRDPIDYAGGENLYGYAGDNPVNEADPSGDDWLDTASNFSAGAGDFLSFGATGRVRQWIGCDDIVDRQSGAYVGGEITGCALSVVEAGASAAGAVRAIRAAGGIRAAIGGATAAGLAQTTLGSTYKLFNSAENLKSVQGFIATSYKAFKAAGGTVRYVDFADAPAEFYKANGAFVNSAKPVIYLIKGKANLGTFVEELIHFDQVSGAGLIGKSLALVERDFEAQAAVRLLDMGFEVAPK